MSAIARTNIRNADEYIVSRKPFTAGGNAYGAANFRGGAPEVTGEFWAGRLVGEDREQWIKDGHSILYVVHSYATPIAWFTADGGWHIVEQKFSSSTSRHQSAVRSALR